MYRCFLLIVAFFTLSLAKSTIDDTNKLFLNTIKRWDVQIKNNEDYKERFKRLVETKAAVDKTTSGVLLDSLNRFSINNNQEQAALIALAARSSNMTQTAAEVPEELNLRKRTVTALPDEYSTGRKNWECQTLRIKLVVGPAGHSPMLQLWRRCTGN